jgi:hypothetical protein
MSLSLDEIDEVIQDYHKIKQDIKKQKYTLNEYKKIINGLMDEHNINIIKGKNLQIKRSIIKRKMLLKVNVPEEVFDKYSILNEYSMLTISSFKNARHGK